MKSIFTKLFFLIIFLNTEMILSQDIYIAGGGNLSDWANLNRFKKENKELTKVDNPERVIFMGNSITEGWLNFNPTFFEDNPFVNRGIGGQTTPQMLIRFRPDVINLKPKAVVIMAGINDIAGNTGQITIKNTADNIISMSEIAIANQIDVYICSTLPAIDFPWSPGLFPAPKVVELNSMLKKYCSKNKIKYVDYYSEMVDENGGLKVPDFTSASDLVHPNLKGYKLMEKILLSNLR